MTAIHDGQRLEGQEIHCIYLGMGLYQVQNASFNDWIHGCSTDMISPCPTKNTQHSPFPQTLSKYSAKDQYADEMKEEALNDTTNNKLIQHVTGTFTH